MEQQIEMKEYIVAESNVPTVTDNTANAADNATKRIYRLLVASQCLVGVLIVLMAVGGVTLLENNRTTRAMQLELANLRAQQTTTHDPAVAYEAAIVAVDIRD